MTNGTIMPREWHQQYNAAYYRKPEVKARRAAHFKARMANPVDLQKILTRRATYNAIRRGALIPQPCEVCGVAKVDGHHDDYAKPMDVRWLCRTHHNEVHGKTQSISKSSYVAVGRGYNNAKKTHCKTGHALSGNNLRVRGARRYCRACDRIRTAKYKAKVQS